MRRIFRAGSAIVLAALLADATVLRAAGNDPPGIVTVRIYDTVSLPEEVLNTLRDTAASVLSSALDLRWLDCTSLVSRDAGCDGPRTSGVVVVRVIAEHEERAACGFALAPQPERGFISLAYECAARGAAFAARKAIGSRDTPTAAQILGYVLAHELVHVLLPGVAHSHEGLFSAHLGRKHWQRHQQGGLAFAPGDIARLRQAARQ